MTCKHDPRPDVFCSICWDEARMRLPLSPSADTANHTTYEVPLLNEREKTHGDYGHNAWIAQRIKEAMGFGAGWEALKPWQKESLHHIATKIARILAGSPNCVDHWEDIAGYANLVVAKLKSGLVQEPPAGKADQRRET